MSTRARTTPPWHGSVVRDDGGHARITLQQPKLYKRWLDTQIGRKVTVYVERFVKRRSNQQNAYWWSVVVPMIGDRCGYLPTEYDAVHDELMRVLIGLRPECHPALQIRVSSRSLSTQEFNQLIEDVQVWAVEKLNGLVIPDPDPEWAFRKDRDERTAPDTRQAARHH